MSKAAMNMAAAKFSAQYKRDDVLFLCISPGVVDVGKYGDCEFSVLYMTLFSFPG